MGWMFVFPELHMVKFLSWRLCEVRRVESHHGIREVMRAALPSWD